MSDPRYYTLVASLPALPHFKRAERLPINRQRLEERLRLLSDKDTSTLTKARAVVEWGAHTANRTDAEFIRRYDIARSATSCDFLLSTLLFRINIRTIIAALRRRLRGEVTGPSSSPWGAGPWVAHIERNWRSADFKLEPVFPWIAPARQHLENGESAALEELLMDVVWNNLGNVPIGRDFALDAVIAFVFKWDIIERRLAYSGPAARNRFSDLGTRILATSPTL
jgi:hypothetical protein